MGSCCCKRKYIQRKTQKKIVLLLVGLDNAGKTTAAKGLAGDISEATIPTVGFTAIKPKTRGFDVTIYDLGGGSQIRDIWISYFHYVHGVIYVVDASDLSRIEESKTIIENLLYNEKLAGKPVLLLANKQDKAHALDEIDIVEILQLEPLVNQQKCHTLVKVCSALPPSSEGKKKIDKRLMNGYRWLLHQVLKDYDNLNERVESDSRTETERFEAQRALQRKRLEESREEKHLVNGIEKSHEFTNGAVLVTPNMEGNSELSRNVISTVRDQLEQKTERQRFMFLRGRRNNKIHPGFDEKSQHSLVETSMTLKALTSPLHIYKLPCHSLPGENSHKVRPLTSRSLGCEVGVWGLERELDIIHPFQVTKHVISEDGIKDEETIVEYLQEEK